MKTHLFLEEALAVGCSDDDIIWAVAPRLLGAKVLKASKRLAWFLRNHIPSLKQMETLELVASALKFQNWHELQSLAQGLVDDFPPFGDELMTRGDGEERCLGLTRALPLLVCMRDGIGPKPNELVGLQKIVDGLRSKDVSEEIAKTVVAKLNGSDSWVDLMSRNARNASEPLYTFVVQENGAGRFIEAAACLELKHELQDRFYKYFQLSNTTRNEAKDWVTNVLRTRNDFIEGYYALGAMYELEHDNANADDLYEMAIKNAERLIPRDFKGLIEWKESGNRFYLKLLNIRMKLCSKYGDFRLAIRLAKKQLRINPNDDLCVHTSLPAMMIGDWEEEKARKYAEKHLRKEDCDSHSLFVLSVAAYVCDDEVQARRDLFMALFGWFKLRRIFDDDFSRDIKGDGRLVTPDFNEVIQTKDDCFRDESVWSTYEHWLMDEKVSYAENELAVLWNDIVAKDKGDVAENKRRTQEWKDRCKVLAMELSKTVN
jgi:tetratricopeptide (TPR) repeat protein